LRKYLHKERLSGGESHHSERVNVVLKVKNDWTA
jgi:hypothetical protein